MKTVWVICEEVDLGYHMVKGFASYHRAESECGRMCEEAKAEQVNWMVKSGTQTKEQAVDWVNQYESDKYWVYEVEVEQ